MKNKKTTYGLLGVLLCLWVYLGYQFLNANPDSNGYVVDVVTPVENNTQPEVEDYKLMLDYPDPFFKKGFERTSTVQTTTSNFSQLQTTIATPIDKEQEAVVVWPDLVYEGSIFNVTNDDKLAIVNISGRTQYLALNQTWNGITVEAIADSSLRVEFKGEKKDVQLNWN